LRIRSRSYNSLNRSTDACTYFSSGSTEDYSITIASAVPAKPIANFYANSTLGTIGNAIELKDISTGVPNSWKWTFIGGTPSTSTVRNPTISYAANGIYPVKLVVTNTLGADSITKLAYITISNSVNIPVAGSSSVTTCGITVYDNGGTSTYSPTSDGTLTILPGSAGSAVKLQFSQFTVDSGDYLYIFNGSSTSSNLISSYSSWEYSRNCV
jgi:PKD repeat protein